MNNAARTSMMFGIGSLACLILSCTPFIGTLFLLACPVVGAVGIYTGMQGRAFAAANEGDGASNAMVGILAGAGGLIAWLGLASLMCVGLIGYIALIVANS